MNVSALSYGAAFVSNVAKLTASSGQAVRFAEQTLCVNAMKAALADARLAELQRLKRLSVFFYQWRSVDPPHPPQPSPTDLSNTELGASRPASSGSVIQTPAR